MTGATNPNQLPNRAAPTAHGSDQSITDEEDSAGVHIGSGVGIESRDSSVEEYTEESGESEEEYAEEDTWTNISKDIGRSESASRPPSSATHHHRLAHRPRREEEGARLPLRSRQARRHQPESSGSVDSGEEQFHGPAADLALREQGRTFYAYTPQQAVQGPPYAPYPIPSPAAYSHYQQPGMPQQQVMPYGQQRQQPQFPYSPYSQPPTAQFPFPSQPRIMPGYGTEAPYGTTAAPYNPYVPYQIPSQIAATQPIHYQYQPVYTPPPPNPTPPITAAAPAPAPIPLAETDAYGDFKKMLMADKAEREARDAAASKAQEEKLAALEDARKRAEEIAKAAAAAATEARTEAETKATAEQKKLKDEADEAATKAKADAEAAAKKFGEEKDAAVKAAEAAGAAAAAVPPEKQKPIKFKDAIGRKFSFPFHLCKTWEGMEDLIRQAFMHIDMIGPHVAEGHYDLIGPNNEIILPGVWDTVIEPDWSVTMHMWPMPEKEQLVDIIDVPLMPGPPPGGKKKSGKKQVKKGGFFSFGAAPKVKGKGKASASAAAAAALAAKK